MEITLIASPITASSKLAAADVQALISAVAPLVSLPSGLSLANAVAVNVIVNADGTGNLNIRFSK